MKNSRIDSRIKNVYRIDRQAIAPPPVGPAAELNLVIATCKRWRLLYLWTIAFIMLAMTTTYGQGPAKNLIANGGFEDVDCNESYETTCDYFFDGIYEECVLPWGNAYGTTAIIDIDGPGASCVAGGHGPEIGSYFALVHSRWVLSTCQREAFFAQLSSPCVLIPGQEYQLSFQARTNNVQFELSTPIDWPNVVEDFWLYVASVQGLDNIQGGSDLDCSNAQVSELGRQVIYSEQGFDTDDAWETVSFSFTPPSGFTNDQIMFWGQYESEDDDHNWQNIFFDNIKLRCASGLTPDPDYDPTGPLSFDFAGDIEIAVSGLEVTEWYWDFGDCIGTSTDQNPSYTYMFPGTYEVCLTITDNRCCTRTVCFEVETDEVDMVTPDVFFCEVCFTTDAMPEGASWDFDDGNFSSDINPCHTFEEAGTYFVEVIYTNGECEYKEVIEVEVVYCGGVDYCEEYGELTPDWVIGENPCSITNASSTWSSPTTISEKKIVVNGRLIIDGTYEFLRCQFEMGPYAEIIVPANRRLEVTSSIFYACDYLWRSVRVMPHGILKMSGVNTSSATIVTGAWSGVFAHSGAILDLSNTAFDCNMLGVYIPPVPSIPDSPLPTSQPNHITLQNFDNLRFVGSNLLPPFVPSCEWPAEPVGSTNFFTVSPLAASYTGVLMYDVADIDLSANSVATSNLYNNMRSGIVAERSNFHVENSSLRNMHPLSGSAYPRSGFGIHGTGNGGGLAYNLTQKGYGADQIPSFKNVRVGIQAIN